MRRIEDVVDVKRFPYVCMSNWTIHTHLGDFEILRGWLSDGASGVPDRDVEAFFSHDRLYAIPFIAGHRVTKWQCDQIYGRLLLKRHHFIHGFIRPLGLSILGLKAWRINRRLESEDPEFWLNGAHARMVPLPGCWRFPSFDTVDAVWEGGRIC